MVFNSLSNHLIRKKVPYVTKDTIAIAIIVDKIVAISTPFHFLY